MSSNSIRGLTLVVALGVMLPCTVSAQRRSALRSGARSDVVQPDHYALRGEFTTVQSTDRPSLARHILLGALAGAALWGVYFALPCDGDCDGSRAQRLVLLPAFSGVGASAGLLTGLVRGAR